MNVVGHALLMNGWTVHHIHLYTLYKYNGHAIVKEVP